MSVSDEKSIITTEDDIVISVYKLITYRSGRVELIRQGLDYLFDETDLSIGVPIQTSNRVSSRVSTAIAVVQGVTNKIIKESLLDNLTEKILSGIVSEVSQEISELQGVTIQTTVDKYLRQCKMTKQMFCKFLLDFYQSNTDSLENQILKYSIKNRKDDCSFVNISFAELKQQLEEHRKK